MSGGEASDALRRHLAAGAPRDAKWRHRLYDLIGEARFAVRDPRIALGPDGFPYYALDVPAPDGPPASMAIGALVELATSSGFGITINGGDAEPWVFTCGDLVTRRAFGTYEFPRIGMPAASGPIVRERMRRAADVSIGAPPASLLPGFVQPLLRRFFTSRLGIREPGVLAMLAQDQEPPEQLVFRLSRADFADDDAFAAALAGVTWFLPRHIVVSVLPPDVVAGLERAFVPLLG